MARKNTTTAKLTNLEMDPAVYQLRRQVIALVYAAKELVPNLPRIEVRVTEDHHRIAGVARTGGNVIWITKEFVASRQIVFHEIAHAAFGAAHVDGCPLMNPSATRAADKFVDAAFIKCARKAGFSTEVSNVR